MERESIFTLQKVCERCCSQLLAKSHNIDCTNFVLAIFITSIPSTSRLLLATGVLFKLSQPGYPQEPMSPVLVLDSSS
jgi:hypothetical protein